MQKGKDYIGVGCGALIVNENGEVLLMKRGQNAKNESGFWSKPGGSVEFGERAEETVIREIKEELDIDIEITNFLNFTDHIIFEENQHWIALNFLAKIKNGEPKIMEPEKCEEIGWFALDALPEKLTQTTREPIEVYKKSLSFRTFTASIV